MVSPQVDFSGPLSTRVDPTAEFAKLVAIPLWATLLTSTQNIVLQEISAARYPVLADPSVRYLDWPELLDELAQDCYTRIEQIILAALTAHTVAQLWVPWAQETDRLPGQPEFGLSGSTAEAGARAAELAIVSNDPAVQAQLADLYEALSDFVDFQLFGRFGVWPGEDTMTSHGSAAVGWGAEPDHDGRSGGTMVGTQLGGRIPEVAAPPSGYGPPSGFASPAERYGPSSVGPTTPISERNGAAPPRRAPQSSCLPPLPQPHSSKRPLASSTEPTTEAGMLAPPTSVARFDDTGAPWELVRAGASPTAPVLATINQRTGAWLLDRLLVGVVLALAALVIVVPVSLDTRSAVGSSNPALVLPLAALSVLLVIGYAIVVCWLIGAKKVSPGKALVGIEIVDDQRFDQIGFGRAVLRGVVVNVFVIGSWLTVWLPYVSVAWDSQRRRRGWHDKAARDVVVMSAKKAHRLTGAL